MRRDWFACDGRGGPCIRPGLPPPGSGACAQASISRRQLLVGAGLAGVAWAARGGTALAQLAVAPGEDSGRGVLVNLFLRGGADGLHMVAPCGEDAYHRLRPNLRLAAPGDRTAAVEDRALPLDGFYGLHPALAPLKLHFDEGRLGLVHAVGSADQTRSHFEAMAAMERGLADDKGSESSGWIARLLAATPSPEASPLRAVALASTMPDALRGATTAVALQSLAEFRLESPSTPEGAQFRDALADLYGAGTDSASQAGRETLAVLETLNRLDPSRYRPAPGAVYPDSDLGRGLRQVACLLKSPVGLEVAFLDPGGWDTHVAQGRGGGWMPLRMDDLARSLAAFLTDIAAHLHRVTVVVQTEFGRRAGENSGLGTDHGRAGVMMIAGGGVVGGRVLGRWPGLEPGQLEGPGDVRVTTDYRDVLAEIASLHLGCSALDAVFPGHQPSRRGFVRSRSRS